MRDKHYRSLIKAVSYRITGTLTTIAISLVLTRKIGMALTIGAGDLVIKVLVYYLHERIWERIRIGKPAQEDYSI